MTWLVITGLFLWVVWLQAKLNSLGEKLDRLTRVERLAVAPSPAPGEPSPPPREPLPKAPPAEPPPQPVPPQLPPARPSAKAIPAVAASAPARSAAPRRSTLEWLSENGLAWLGGGALALGGLFLVAFAAEHGFFTPLMRLVSAVVLGFGALGAGEWLRRGRAGGQHDALVAALLTAAGSAILYATIWAAHTLYGYLPAVPAAVLLTLVCAGLVGLAFLHGEAVGLLGVLAAFAVPAVSGGAGWSAPPLDAYLLLIGLTGAMVAALRNWAAVGAVTIAGLGCWILARLPGTDVIGVAVLSVAAVALTAAAEAYRRHQGPERQSRLFDWLPTAACVAASLVLFVLFMRASDLAPASAGLAMIAVSVILALAARNGPTSNLLLLAPALVALLWALVQYDTTSATALSVIQVGWLVALLATIAIVGLFGALTGRRSLASANIAALVTPLALVLVSPAMGRDFRTGREAVLAGFVALLAGGAGALARRAAEPRTDPATGAWVAAASLTTALLAQASLDGRILPIAFALVGLALAGLRLRWPWRGFAESAAVASLASFAALLTPAVAGAVLAGHQTWLVIAALSFAATLIQAATWRALKSLLEVQGAAETASTAALLSGLVGAFLVLRTLGAPIGGHGPGLDFFTEASFRTILLLTAGLVLAIRRPTTLLGRIRAPVLIAAAALHGLVCEGLAFHPWWGLGGAVDGPPVFDSILVGLFAPAVLLLEASRRFVGSQPRLATPTATCALLFLLLWIVSEVRRLYHGPLLGVGPTGYAEAASYALALAASACALAGARRHVIEDHGFDADFSAVLSGWIWLAIGAALWLLALTASPWWGPLDGEARSPALLGGAYALTAAFTGWSAALAARSGRVSLSRFATVAAGVEGFVLLTLVIRFAFHGSTMRAALTQVGLETWTFSAAWALYGLIVLAIGARTRLIALRWLGLSISLLATAKVFLFDMARLEGVIRAASFLALGVLLLIGALAARRFGQTAKPPSAT